MGSLDSNFKYAQILSLDYIMKLLCETCFSVMKTTLEMFSNHILLLVSRRLGNSFRTLRKCFWHFYYIDKETETQPHSWMCWFGVTTYMTHVLIPANFISVEKCTHFYCWHWPESHPHHWQPFAFKIYSILNHV